jgi:deazaflavin-dependent oxidoreductase (nitroreductase family)
MSRMSDFNATIVNEFRANQGRVGGDFTGAPMIVLTTTGARSGQKRTTPLVYLPEGDQVVIFASKAGAPSNPDWYHNLVAHPRVTVEVGADTFEADATVVHGDERDRLYAAQSSVMPGFAEYQAKTDRVIPVVVLTRVESDPAGR